MPQADTPDEKWAKVIKQLFPKFREFFQTEQELLDISLGFREIYKDDGKAMYELFSLSEYLVVLGTIKNDFVRLIMLTSIIEKLNSKKEYIPFTQWLTKRERIKSEQPKKEEPINKLWTDYNKDYGCSGKFRRYFKGLKEEEQIQLLTTIQQFDNVNGRAQPIPVFCYDASTCSDKVGLCVNGHVFLNCPCLQNKKKLNDSIKEFSEYLYSLRNNFVHNAIVTHFSEQSEGKSAIPLFHYVPYTFKYMSRPNYSGYVWIKLTGLDLEKKVRRDFRNLLTNYIENRKN